jgi:hypothetical protein
MQKGKSIFKPQSLTLSDFCFLIYVKQTQFGVSFRIADSPTLALENNFKIHSLESSLFSKNLVAASLRV